MSIFRNEQSVARQDILEAGWTCVDHLRELADRLPDRPLAQVLESLAAAKEEHLAALEEEVRRAGELPILPDRDLETLEELVDWAEAALAGEGKNGTRAVLRQRLEAERRLATLIEQRQALPFAEGERRVIDALLAQAREAGQRLEEELGALDRGDA